MNKLSKRTGYGLDLHTQRIRTRRGDSKETGGEPVVKPDYRLERHRRKGFKYQPAPIWHNALYGMGTAGVILVPHYVFGQSYVDIMLGITAVAFGVFFVVSLLGVFQGVLPFGHQSQYERQRRR